MAIERPSDFSADVSAWVPVTVGDAQLALSSVSRGDKPALRMDFDFGDAGGFWWDHASRTERCTRITPCVFGCEVAVP